MTIRYNYTWPAINTTAVCNAQNAIAATPLVFNGTFADPYHAGQISFIKNNLTSNISIGSVNDLSGINFTITGIQNGAIVSEVLAGAIANTNAYSVNTYDIITSIIPSNNALQVEVGTGNLGYLPPIKIDSLMNTGMLNWAFQVIVNQVGVDPIGWGLYYTLDNIQNTGVPFSTLITNGTFLEFSGNQNTSIITQNYLVANYLLLKVNNSPAIGNEDVLNSLRLIYMQIQ